MNFFKFPLSYYFGIALIVFFVFPAQAQKNIAKLKRDKAKNTKNIVFTQRLLQNTQSKQKVSLGLLSVLGRKIRLQEKHIKNIQTEMLLSDKLIANTSDEIHALEIKYKKLTKQYEKIILFAYKQKGSRNKLMFLLASKDFNQAYRRYKYMQQFSEYGRKQGEMLVETKVKLDIKLDRLNKAKLDKQSLYTQKSVESKRLSVEKSKQANVLGQLKKQEKQLLRDLNKQKRFDRRLKKEIQKIILASRKKRIKNKKNNKKNSYEFTPEEKKLAEKFWQNKGKLPWPTITGFISQPFGRHDHAVLRHVKVNNDGIDITTDKQSKCRAVFNGKVAAVGSLPGLNMFVVIRHGSYITVYSNLANVIVEKGDVVIAKQTIGVVYTDKKTNLTILKFQLWKKITKLNPASWLKTK